MQMGMLFWNNCSLLGFACWQAGQVNKGETLSNIELSLE